MDAAQRVLRVPELLQLILEVIYNAPMFLDPDVVGRLPKHNLINCMLVSRLWYQEALRIVSQFVSISSPAAKGLTGTSPEPYRSAPELSNRPMETRPWDFTQGLGLYFQPLRDYNWPLATPDDFKVSSLLDQLTFPALKLVLIQGWGYTQTENRRVAIDLSFDIRPPCQLASLRDFGNRMKLDALVPPIWSPTNLRLLTIAGFFEYVDVRNTIQPLTELCTLRLIGIKDNPEFGLARLLQAIANLRKLKTLALLLEYKPSTPEILRDEDNPSTPWLHDVRASKSMISCQNLVLTQVNGRILSFRDLLSIVDREELVELEVDEDLLLNIHDNMTQNFRGLWSQVLTFANLTKLSLNMRFTEDRYGAGMDVNFENLVPLGTRCPKLKHFRLNSDAVEMPIAGGIGFRNITDENVDKFTTALPELNYLDIQGSQEDQNLWSARSIIAIGRNCRYLETLSLSGQVDITDDNFCEELRIAEKAQPIPDDCLFPNLTNTLLPYQDVPISSCPYWRTQSEASPAQTAPFISLLNQHYPRLYNLTRGGGHGIWILLEYLEEITSAHVEFRELDDFRYMVETRKSLLETRKTEQWTHEKLRKFIAPFYSSFFWHDRSPFVVKDLFDQLPASDSVESPATLFHVDSNHHSSAEGSVDANDDTYLTSEDEGSLVPEQNETSL